MRNGISSFALFSTGLVGLWLSTAGSAAEVSTASADDVRIITVSGPIEPGDDRKFKRIAAQHEEAIVFLDSQGGAVGPALEIGKAINLREYATVVPENSLCASACALIWLAGTERFLSESGRLGFHASYRDEDGAIVESGVANALVGHYLSQLNLPSRAVMFATLAPPHEILWLDSETKPASGIQFEFLEAPTTPDVEPSVRNDTEPTYVVGPASRSTGPALWKAADEDTTIYLFGTVHALPEDVDWFDDSIASALAESSTIVTEIEMNEATTASMQQLVMSKGILPPETTLRSLLDEDQKTSFETAMGKLGIPAAAFDKFEPWYAGMMMSMLPLMQQGYSPESGVETVILQHAGERQKGSLETIEFQIGLFDSLPMDSQIEFLIEASDNVDEIKTQLDAMVQEWIEGDADELANLMNEGLTDETLAEVLLYSRNRNWAEWIDTRLDTPGTVFMAVGAGHLAGDQSVQQVLVERGIEVERVR